MISYRRTKAGKLIGYYKKKNYKKSRFRKIERRAERWYERTFGEKVNSIMVEIR